MIKTHCDRCDCVVGDQVTTGVDLSRSLLEDCDVKRGFGAVHAKFSIEAFTGDTFSGRGKWEPVHLCAHCMAFLLDHVVKVLRSEIVRDELQAMEATGDPKATQ